MHTERGAGVLSPGHFKQRVLPRPSALFAVAASAGGLERLPDVLPVMYKYTSSVALYYSSTFGSRHDSGPCHART